MKIRNLALSLLAASTLLCTACGKKSKHNDTPAATTATDNDDDGDEKTVSQNGLFAVEVEWSEDLTSGVYTNSAVVHFHDPKTGAHVDATLKTFSLYHTTMGHGSDFGDAMVFTQLDLGHWKVDKVYFSMPGAADEWAADITAEVGGQTDSVRVPVHAVVK